jgi:hypothetical protein
VGGGKGVGLHYKRFGAFLKVKTMDLQGNSRRHPAKIFKKPSQYRKSG